MRTLALSLLAAFALAVAASPLAAAQFPVPARLDVTTEPLFFSGKPEIPPGETARAGITVKYCTDTGGYNADGSDMTLTVTLGALPSWGTVTIEGDDSYVFKPQATPATEDDDCNNTEWGLFIAIELNKDAPANETGTIEFTISADAAVGTMEKPADVQETLDAVVAYIPPDDIPPVQIETGEVTNEPIDRPESNDSPAPPVAVVALALVALVAARGRRRTG